MQYIGNNRDAFCCNNRSHYFQCHPTLVITCTKSVLPYLRSVLAMQHTYMHRVMYDKAQIQLHEYCLPISNMRACSVLIMCRY